VEPVLYIMAILGCADSETQCEPVRTAPAIYATADACAGAEAQVLTASSDVPYPVVMTQCRPASAKVAAKLTGQALASR
jgi:hypothetical protein